MFLTMGHLRQLCVVLVLVLCITSTQQNGVRYRRDTDVDTVYSWRQLEFSFPNMRDEKEAIANGNLVPENAIPIDVAPHYKAAGKFRVFVTIPRFSMGIPYSLATVSNDSDFKLMPYPQYNMHKSHGSNCDGITSAFRVAFTPCNQMWVIDSGLIGGVQHCAPQLLLFDLTTDRLLHRYRFESGVYTPTASLLITPVVKVNDPPPAGSCKRTTVYVADVNFHGLIVYDYEKNAAWRAEHRFMYPDPDFGVHKIAGESFNLMDGIFGLSVYGDNLYFHPLASSSQYMVPLASLADRAAWQYSVESHPNDFKSLGIRRSECGAEAVDSRGNIFCVTFKPIALTYWNVHTPFKQKYLRDLSKNEEVLQFVSGMKVVKNLRGKEELWMLSNRFQKSAAGTLSANDINFRIMKRPLDDLDDMDDINHIGQASNHDLQHKLIFN